MNYLSYLLFILLMSVMSSYSMEEDVGNVQKNRVLSLKSLALTELILDHAKKISDMEESAAQEMLMLTASNMQYKVPEQLQSHYLSEVARTHYFLFNHYVNVGCDYGFSIGELIAYGRIPKVLGALFARACYPRNSFVIKKNYRINSLAGLESIPLKNYITECVINHNMLSTLSSHFSCLSALEILNMSHNRINIIEDTALQKLAKLTTLDLSHNNLKHIKEHSFSGCTRLMLLNLNDNEIDIIESGSLSHLVGLGIVNLINNQLSMVPQEMFKLTQLQILMLGENNISKEQQDHLKQVLDNTVISFQKRSQLSNLRTYIRTMHDDAT